MGAGTRLPKGLRWRWKGQGSMSPEPTVFVVDHDPAVHDLVCRLVESVGLKAEVFSSAQEFLDVYDTGKPGCLVLDIRLAGMSGLDLLDELATRGVAIPAIIVTGFGDVATAVRAMKAGALDFIEKPFCHQRLLDRIQQCLTEDARNRQEQAMRREVMQDLALLTARQRQVMDLVVVGKSNKEIAQNLSVRVKTVEAHRAEVMKKMHAASLVDLVQLVLAERHRQGKPSSP